VEALVSGHSATIGGDISYLMRTSPNHHRGLIAIMRLVERTKNPQPRDLQYSIDCYFDRAVRFAPDDVIVRMLFARFLGTRNRLTEARSQLDHATRLAEDNGLTHFNIGLTFFDLGMYPEALARAHSAKSLGFARPELEARLREKGQWADPIPDPTPAGTGSPASAPPPG
jgi:tetratricopeptide (TPR) repeat protein